MKYSKLNGLVDDFERILNRPANEEQIHAFLFEHPCLLNLLLPPHVGGRRIYSKVPIGLEFVTDFVAIVPRTFGPTYYLFELELSTAPIFTKAGDFSSVLSHSIRQVLDWRQWIAEHREYASSIMPGIDNPLGVIIIGRRAGLKDSERKRLSQFLFDNGGKVDIVTYDRILDIARLDVHGRYTRTHGRFDPKRAFTSKELKVHAKHIKKEWADYFHGASS